MGNVRVTLPAELHDLVRDAVAEIESASGSLDLAKRSPRNRAPQRERRASPQAAILHLPAVEERPPAAPATVPATVPATDVPAGSTPAAPPPPSPEAPFITAPAPDAAGVTAAPPAEVPVAPVPPRRRAFLARVEVPSTVPGMRLSTRTRRLPVACRRASSLDAARTSRMLRVAVPASPVAPATLASPPAWLLAAMPPPCIAPTPVLEAGTPAEPASVTLAGRLALPGGTTGVAETFVPTLALTPAVAPLAAPAAREPGRPLWREAASHIGNLAIAAALALVVLFCGAMVGLVATGHHLEEVVTGSMQPTIPIGSLVVTEQLPAGQLQVGDILVFPDPNNTKLTIVHRIVWLGHDQTGDVLVRTKGDYNALADSWTIKRQSSAEADRVVYIIPGGGTFAGYLQTVGFWGLLVLIIGVIGYYGIRKVRQILDEDENHGAGDTNPRTAGERAR